jgi:glutamate/tyrosine decarboxylase-like PLP-dependent enzyme
MASWTDPLSIGADEMRTQGYRTVDLLIERLSGGRPGLRRVPRAETERRLGGPPPERPEPFEEVLGRVDEHVIGLLARADHPAFFAFVPGQPTWPGALADLIAGALNVHAIDWIESPGASQVELTVIDWFCGWFGYPQGSGGILTSGGSAGNMTALACAREILAGPMSDDLVIYLADQAHSSMARAARILGFRPNQVRVLPVDSRFRMRADALERSIEVDVRAGRRPLLVSAAAGSTNTGAVDPLVDLATVARAAGAWFHVDAAYGGGAVITDRGRALLSGIELADSITVDPHKWLYQPYECGMVLVRDLQHLHAAFELVPDYLQDASSALNEPNFSDLGMQLTRGARGLKLWISIRSLGLAAFRDAVNHSLDLAEDAARRIESSPHLELAAPPSLGVVCFRRRLDGAEPGAVDRANAGLVARLADSGEGFISSTRLGGRVVLRMCILNHGTSGDDVDRVISFLESADVRDPPAEERGYETRREAVPGWVRGARSTPHELRDTRLFADLSDPQLDRIRRVGFLLDVARGAAVVEQWTPTRELYVILEGRVEIRDDGARVATLGPGDHFGEIAALDWAGGYGYARTAMVVARSALRLFVIPEGALADIVRELPLVGDRIRRDATERLRDR